jgi:hypothetical protein
MATRSTIGMQFADGIRAVYCHWDGYPDEDGGVGETLKQYYTDRREVINLLDKGDLSVLKPTVEECVFYTDRGEELRTHTFASTEEWIDWANGSGCEYSYLFENDAWNWEKI